jgi:hypothetical protein
MTQGIGRSCWQKLPTPTRHYHRLWALNRDEWTALVFTYVRLCSFVSTWLFQRYRFLLVSRSTSERQMCVFLPGRASSPAMTPVPHPVKEIIAFMKPAASTPWPQEPSIFVPWARLIRPSSILFLDYPLQYCPTAYNRCSRLSFCSRLPHQNPACIPVPRPCRHFICLLVSANSTE